MRDGRKLNIVDNEAKIIGIATRDEIHRKGLAHREVHVWFYAPKGEIIFQHRAKDKETYADLLDATVGGHVEIGDEIEDTVRHEVQEETGIELKPENLTFLWKQHVCMNDPVSGLTNNAFQWKFIYRYEGALADLKVESGKGQGFEAWPVDRLLTLPETERSRFIPLVFSDETLAIFRRIQDRLSSLG